MLNLIIIIDSGMPIRLFIDPNAKEILPDHYKILTAIWPKGDKAILYNQVPQAAPGRPSLYKSYSNEPYSYTSNRNSIPNITSEEPI